MDLKITINIDSHKALDKKVFSKKRIREIKCKPYANYGNNNNIENLKANNSKRIVKVIDSELIKIERIILNYLKMKKDYAKANDIINYLLTKFDWKVSPVFIRHTIANLRSKGYTIVASSQYGYFFTKNKELIFQYVESRIKELEKERLILKNAFGW